MSDTMRCEPPDKRLMGYHWLLKAGEPDILVPAVWYFDGDGYWTWGGQQRRAEDVANDGFRYVAPVTPAPVVAALVQALDEIAAQNLCDDMDADTYLNADFGGAYEDVVKMARAALARAKEAGL